jgi:hypothetical protein
MTTSYLPTTREIHALFLDEVRTMGCVRPEVCVDDMRLFARAVCTQPAEVRRGDAVLGGVALRVMDDLIDVHPFILRRVCTNGAVMAEALESQRVRRVEVPAMIERVTAALDDVRAAIKACADPAAFANAVRMMQQTTRRVPDLMSTLLLRLIGVRPRDYELRAEMVERYMRQHDPSAFGLVNAVTSIARDTADPERRWNIERMGGTMLALLSSGRKSGPGSATVPEEALIDACA